MDRFLTFICFVIIFSAIANWLAPWDSTDNAEEKERSGMTLYIDHLTGCQYLSGSNLFGSTGMTPRLNKDGTQYCER